MLRPENILPGLSKADYDFLEGRLKEVFFPKNSHLLRAGQVQKELFLVLEGVQMSLLESDKKTHVMAFTYAPGLSAVPESFLRQQPSDYDLIALSDTRVLSLAYEDLQVLLTQSHAMERLMRQMTEQVLCGVLERHKEALVLDMESRFKAFCLRSPQLLHLVPHKYLAAYLGMDATNFSKLFNKVKI